MQLATLGRQAGISVAELEAIYGAKSITTIGEYAALVDSSDPLPQAMLGGTMKSAAVLRRLENTDLSGAFTFLQEFLPEHFMYLPKGKLQFGVSVYGYKAQKDWLLKRMLSLKKVIKKTGQSVRIIENKSEALEAAQILYNKLTAELGCELLLVRDGQDVVIAQTTAVQDIDDYAQRDFERPMRDAFVGMLPPKLAQVMINLSGASAEEFSGKTTIFDPFCGTGVVLQEALLMGYDALGSDLADKMVDYSTQNLQWLQEVRTLKNSWDVLPADATKHQWGLDKLQSGDNRLFVVCETYLGRPLSGLPPKPKFDEICREADTIAERFLRNIAKQLQPGARLCVALPAWHLGDGRFRRLKTLDHLADMGYNRLDFVHANTSELVYHRSEQIVARELTVLVRR